MSMYTPKNAQCQKKIQTKVDGKVSYCIVVGKLQFPHFPSCFDKFFGA